MRMEEVLEGIPYDILGGERGDFPADALGGEARGGRIDASSNASPGIDDVYAHLDVHGIAYASGSVTSGDLFFCVPGFKSDGHDYAADAAARGAAALVVEHEVPVPLPQYKVTDSRKALALAASNLYRKPSTDLLVCGITGTNGKTTTTYLVEGVARSLGWKTGVIGTVETRVGDERRRALHTTPESLDLQRTLADMRDADVKLVAMEVSSHAIDLDRVAGTSFAVVAFSNLTQDHLDFHHDMDSYFAAKAALFAYDSVAARVICIDDEYGKHLLRICREAGYPVLTVGRDETADIHASDVQLGIHSTALTLVTPEGRFELEFPLIGAFNVQNLLLACGICSAVGMPFPAIAAALAQAPQVPGRLERVLPAQGGKPDFPVFVDYAHTPDSIEKALAAVRTITPGRVIIVFGCGGDRDAGKRPKMGAAACAADHLIITSDNPRSEDPIAIIHDIVPGLVRAEGRYEIHPDRREAICRAVRMAKAGDAILIAGKGHEGYQLVGDKVLDFDDRLVAAAELTALCTRDACGEKGARPCD